MRIVFMGTPEFAVPSLEALVNRGHEVLSVFTQSDKPKGRGKRLTPPPIKEKARELNIKVYQPERINNAETIKLLEEIAPDCIVVVAYGQLLRKKILELPKYGCINIHASLLPKFRGAAPINWAIIKGEEVTGITVMHMNEGLDTGDMILKKEVEVHDKTAGELIDELAALGANAIGDTLDLLVMNIAPRIKQNEILSSYAPMLNKGMGSVMWNKSAREIHNLIRGLNPWPTAFTTYKGENFKIWKSKYIHDVCNDQPGSIIMVSKKGIYVSTGNGILVIEELQFPNGKRMEVGEYLKGNTLKKNEILGE